MPYPYRQMPSGQDIEPEEADDGEPVSLREALADVWQPIAIAAAALTILCSAPYWWRWVA